MATKRDGKLGGADFRDANGNGSDAGATGDTNTDAGINNGIGADDSTTGDRSDAGITELPPERIAGINVADPADFGSDGNAPYGRKADGTPRKPPGRKPGNGSSVGSRGPTRATQKGAPNNQSVDGLQKLLLSMHMMGATFLKTPELAIANDEAKMLATAIADVQAHYSFEVSPEITLWSNVAIAAAAVYGPRVVLIMNRKSKEKAEKRPTASVVSIKKDNSSFDFSIPGMHDPVQ